MDITIVHLLQGVAASSAIGAAFGHFLTKQMMKRAFKQKQLRRTIEIIGVEPMYRGESIILDFTVNQDPKSIDTVFANMDALEREIETATKRMNGSVFLRLANGDNHRLMMETLEDTITGQDPDANVDARAGREVDEDGEYFFPTYHPDANGVRKIRVYVVNEKLFKRLGVPNLDIRASKKRRAHAVEVLLSSYVEWASDASKSGDTACVWHTTNKTSARAGMSEGARRVA